jgi:hypothetical protein
VYNIVNYLSSGKVSGDMTISNDSLVLNGSNYIEYSGEVNYRYSVNLILKSASNSGNNPSLIGPSPYPSLYLNSSDGYKYYFNSQGVNSSLGQAFKTGDNQYVTLVYDGSNVILYVNGSKVGSVETTTDPSSLESVKIGNGFVGNLSKAEVYNRSLNSEEVKQLYRTNKMNES